MTAPLATVGPTAYWYLTRGTGIAALILLTASVVLGILGSLRFAAVPRWPRFAIDTLHRDVSLLVIVLLVVHIVTSVADGFAPVTLVDGVLPFLSRYRPLWLGLGALSFDVLLALVITSLIRRQLGYRSWRLVHWLAYASWPLAVLHGLGTGSDTKLGWVLAITAACVLAVVAAVVVRIFRGGPQLGRWRLPASGLALVLSAAIALFTVLGPLQRGWARRAGTPTALLSGAVSPRASGVPVAAHSASPPTGGSDTKPTLKAPFTARISGSVTQTPAGVGELIDLSLRLSGQAHGQLRIRLAGSPMDGGGVTLTGSQVDLLAGGLPSVMQGRVVSLDGDDLVARVSADSAGTLELRVNLDVDPQTGDVSGQLHAVKA